MSIDFSARIVVGVKEEDADLSKLTDAQMEDIVENWMIDTNSWCGGAHIFGDEWSWCSEGEYQDITRIMNKWELDAEREYVRIELEKCGLVVPIDDIKAYLICRVF